MGPAVLRPRLRPIWRKALRLASTVALLSGMTWAYVALPSGRPAIETARGATITSPGSNLLTITGTGSAVLLGDSTTTISQFANSLVIPTVEGKPTSSCTRGQVVLDVNGPTLWGCDKHDAWHVVR